ncbi:hypothetical protein [Legionella worsleiensis]|uniref:Uncharacterized protein n=1 Tax=Legionella worsleiensis TaxID=45076 RepID=A0A0W1A642_9GAMM|nr:hypothetical protein [Legionella worsleiensis]KTD76844.1 hypothetical protein Lwor_2069 [Legionella worsleiensis]STY30720.1 Uncharacterised protein [Legionella worsleiensis]
MVIDINELINLYKPDSAGSENAHWIMIPDSKDNVIYSNAIGAVGDGIVNGWKIHISIAPEQMAQAVVLIAQELINEDAPRAAIKFASNALARTGQPSKQVAVKFYDDELKDKKAILNFLNRIDATLKAHKIGTDKRPINSDEMEKKAKYDAVIYDDLGTPSRFNYRNENCIVLLDDIYQMAGGVGDTTERDGSVLVRQSYYLQLPDSQRHNPGNRVEDPFATFRITSQLPEQPNVQDRTGDLGRNPLSSGLFATRSCPENPTTAPMNSNFTSHQVTEINHLIDRLEKEIRSFWPYPNKDRKEAKVEGLKQLLEKSQTMSPQEAVKAVETQFPDIRKGALSTRTADLLDSLKKVQKSLGNN